MKPEDKDPFIDLWKSNFETNLTRGYLNRYNSKPFNILRNLGVYLKCPVVLIAAGPSLDKNVRFLKNYEDKCIIICADVCLFKLIEHGITPDFVVNLDPHESICRFFEGLDTENLILICPITTNPKTIESWKGGILYYVQTDSESNLKGITLKKIGKPYLGWGSFFNLFFIGATMFQIACTFNPAVIMLAGYDFGFSEDKPYCDGFLDRKIFHLEDPVGSERHTEIIKQLKEAELKRDILFKADDTTDIWTTHTFLLYKRTLLFLIQQNRYRVINSTEGGILTEIERMPLKRALDTFCQTKINKFRKISELDGIINSKYRHRRKRKK